MNKIFLIFLISVTTFGITGCKDVLDQITGMSQNDTPDHAYQKLLSADLKIFDQIRTQQNSVYIQLEDKLNQAARTQTSTSELRNELQDLANTLANQNNSFKNSHIQTSEVARLRNTIMQLNYSTMQIIQIVDNPNTVNNRLPSYLSKQRSLINSYNQLRTDVEMKL